jgi:hypothetical protein
VRDELKRAINQTVYGYCGFLTACDWQGLVARIISIVEREEGRDQSKEANENGYKDFIDR